MADQYITINGVRVDAAVIIDDLSGQIAQAAIERAVLRAQVAEWAALAHARVVDGPPPADEGSEGSTGPDPEPVADGPPGLWPYDGL